MRDSRFSAHRHASPPQPPPRNSSSEILCCRNPLPLAFFLLSIAIDINKLKSLVAGRR
ncbi:hypothetical protein DY000_02041738 [Brassica cretica]|uniref:Uncharacterized protein n=1 Tax=Brassica cretica TaxID=69181 RepID=A0ABQ7BCN8_BRACR|nr:hypothetical protein DY000_02041738 [Brassica cretica]